MTTAIYSDFRGQGHTATGHWNDPSDAIFRKTTSTEKRELEEHALLQHLQEYLLICKEQNPSQKRMLTDTEKRLNVLFEKLQNDALSSSLLAQLEMLVKAIEGNDFVKAQSVHVDLMTTEFNSEGKWLVGLKRLLDLYQKSRLSAE